VRDVIITSMVKRVDVAVYRFVGEAIQGTARAGEQIFDLRAGGVDYATTGGHVDDIKPRLDELKQQIISGEIKVPSST
jgi:basic membrane protein A